MKCYYPQCEHRGRLICTCCFVEWCGEHIDNHYKAMEIGK